MVKSQFTELKTITMETITMGVITEANINKFNRENIKIHLFNNLMQFSVLALYRLYLTWVWFMMTTSCYPVLSEQRSIFIKK